MANTILFIQEAVIRRCSVKKTFLKNLQNLPKNVFAGVPILIKLQAENLELSDAATGGVL